MATEVSLRPTKFGGICGIFPKLKVFRPWILTQDRTSQFSDQVFWGVRKFGGLKFGTGGQVNFGVTQMGVSQFTVILRPQTVSYAPKTETKTHEFSFSGSFGMRKQRKQAFFSVFSFRNFPKMKTRGFLVFGFWF